MCSKNPKNLLFLQCRSDTRVIIQGIKLHSLKNYVLVFENDLYPINLNKFYTRMFERKYK